MPAYRCRDCGQTIFTGEGLNAGRLSIPCSNRECRSRRTRPARQQRFNFGKRPEQKK